MNGIDENLLSRFMDDVCAVVKGDGTEENANSHDISKCKPLCTVEFLDGDEGVSFSVEIRGYVRDEDAYFIVGRVKGHDEKFFSRGFFTARGGHQTLYAMTHDAPRGMSIQQGVLIEVRNLVKRMIDDIKLLPLNTLRFLTMMSEQLDAMKVKVVVVKSDDNADGIPESQKDDESLGRLEIRGDMKPDEFKERKSEPVDEKPVEPVEDTIGETFAKAVGNKSESPEDGNPIDDALKNSQEYVVRKETLWDRIRSFLRRIFGLDREKEELNSLCGEMFSTEKEKEGND